MAWSGEAPDGDMPYLLAYTLGDGQSGPEGSTAAVADLLTSLGLSIGEKVVDGAAHPSLPVTLLVEAGQAVVTMPQLNVWQSDLVHRYYAEMAHYADTVTGISYSTTAAVQAFFEHEQLPLPVMATNQVPTVALRDAGARSDGEVRRHRLEGQPYVLSVSITASPNASRFASSQPPSM